MLHRSVHALAFILATVSTAPAAQADDITDSIQEGLKQYEAGRYSEAAASLTYASQLILQKKGDALKTALPPALPGWQAEAGESSAAGAALGAGLTVSRRYRKDGADIKVRIVTDSPMIQGVAMMLANPIMATSGGGRLERVGGEKALVQFDPQNRRGELQMMIGNRFLVSIEGRNVAREDLLAYAGAVDLEVLRKLP